MRNQLTCIFAYDAQCFFFWGSPIIGEADLIFQSVTGGSSPSEKSRCPLSRFKKKCRVNIGAPQKDQSSIGCTWQNFRLWESEKHGETSPKGILPEIFGGHLIILNRRKKKNIGDVFFFFYGLYQTRTKMNYEMDTANLTILDFR